MSGVLLGVHLPTALISFDRNAAKAAERHFLSGDTGNGNAWLSRISNAGLRDNY